MPEGGDDTDTLGESESRTLTDGLRVSRADPLTLPDTVPGRVSDGDGDSSTVLLGVTLAHFDFTVYGDAETDVDTDDVGESARDEECVGDGNGDEVGRIVALPTAVREPVSRMVEDTHVDPDTVTVVDTVGVGKTVIETVKLTETEPDSVRDGGAVRDAADVVDTTGLALDITDSDGDPESEAVARGLALAPLLKDGLTDAVAAAEPQALKLAERVAASVPDESAVCDPGAEALFSRVPVTDCVECAVSETEAVSVPVNDTERDEIGDADDVALSRPLREFTIVRVTDIDEVGDSVANADIDGKCVRVTDSDVVTVDVNVARLAEMTAEAEGESVGEESALPDSDADMQFECVSEAEAEIEVRIEND